jgi:hypothetical protein
MSSSISAITAVSTLRFELSPTEKPGRPPNPLAFTSFVHFPTVPRDYSVHDNSLSYFDFYRDLSLKTVFSFTRVAPDPAEIAAVQFEPGSAYFIFGDFLDERVRSEAKATCSIAELRGHDFYQLSGRPVSNLNLIEPSKQPAELSFRFPTVVTLPNHSWLVHFGGIFQHFLALKSGRFDLPFAEKMQQFIKGKRVVVLSVINLSGKRFEDEVKLKAVSVSQESVVTKSGLETELGDIQSQLQCDSLCSTLSQHLKASVNKGRKKYRILFLLKINTH